MLPSSKAHLQIEDPLEIVDPFTRGDHVVGPDLPARHRAEVLGVPLHVLHHLGRLFSELVVRRHDVIPGKLAEAAEAEPGTE